VEHCRETVFEIPLLFENGNEGRFATVWVVSAPREVQIQRLKQRDGLDAAEAQARLDAQMSVAEKAARASYVILNDGDMAALNRHVDEGLRLWRERRVVSA
jgi:dephospho-CoA kinase